MKIISVPLFALLVAMGSSAFADTITEPSLVGTREDQPLATDTSGRYPKDPDALLLQSEGEDLLDQRNYAQAEEKFRRSYEIEQSVAALMDRAVCLFMLGKEEAARDIYLDILKRHKSQNDTMSFASQGLAEVYFTLAKKAEAREGVSRSSLELRRNVCMHIGVAITYAPNPLAKNTFSVYEKQKFGCEVMRKTL